MQSVVVTVMGGTLLSKSSVVPYAHDYAVTKSFGNEKYLSRGYIYYLITYAQSFLVLSIDFKWRI